MRLQILKLVYKSLYLLFNFRIRTGGIGFSCFRSLVMRGFVRAMVHGANFSNVRLELTMLQYNVLQI
jgi:hypothetical protein